MKKIGNLTAGELTKIHGITFAIFIVIDTVLTELLYPILDNRFGNDLLLVAIELVISGILYSVIYMVTKKVCDFINIRKNRILDIGGKWYHVHIPHVRGERSYAVSKLRAGDVDVARELYDFTFKGTNFYYELNDDGELAENHTDDTRWYTKSSKISDQNDFDVIEIYEAQTKNRAQQSMDECPFCKTKFAQSVNMRVERFRHGVHKYDIIDNGRNKPTKIEGEYSDCYPSFKSGEILLFKSRQERDAVVKQFLAEAKRRKAESCGCAEQNDERHFMGTDAD